MATFRKHPCVYSATFPLPPFIGSQGTSGIRADLANICKKKKRKKLKAPKLDWHGMLSVGFQ